MIVKSLRKFVSTVSSSSSFAEWDTGLSADLDVTSDHDGSGYTLVLTWDKPLSSFEQWSGTASSSDQMWVFLGSKILWVVSLFLFQSVALFVASIIWFSYL